MKHYLKCPKGKNFPLKGPDREREAITCPFHKQEIDVDEARRRYYYYRNAYINGAPLPRQYLTEHDKKKDMEQNNAKDQADT